MSAGKDLRPSVVWAGDGIEIIDQTLLPDRLETLRLTAIPDVVEAIRALRVRGAPAIGICGAYGVVVGLRETPAGADLAARLAELRTVVGDARPTAVNLSWAVDRVVAAAQAAADLAEAAELALAAAHRIQEDDRARCDAIGRYGRELLAGVDAVATVCNTGRLATGGRGTALAAIYAKAEAGEPVTVLAAETRPLLQGARLTAWELVDAGIPVTLVPDGAVAFALARGKAGAAIVGADRIAANGDTANKIGTLGLALAARAAGVPFYVAAPLSTFDPRTPHGRAIEIEERAADEVRAFGGARVAPDGAGAWNPAFDVTPHELITAIVTEQGVLRPPFDVAIRELEWEAR